MIRPMTVLAIALVAAALHCAPAAGEDLLQIYRDAERNDPTLAGARANYAATKEAVPQARAGLLPNVSVTGARMPTVTTSRSTAILRWASTAASGSAA